MDLAFVQALAMAAGATSALLPPHVEDVMCHLQQLHCQAAPSVPVSPPSQQVHKCKGSAGQIVLDIPDLVFNIVRHLGWLDAGSLLLSCRVLHAAVTQECLLPYNPTATSLVINLKHAQALPNPSDVVTLNRGSINGHCLSAITSIKFRRPLSHECKARVLFQLRSLRELDLEYLKLGPPGAEALAAPLKQLAALTWLGLSGNELGAPGIAALTPALAKLKKLQSLWLYNNALGAEGARVLARVLPQLGDNLTYLSMGMNALRSEGVRVLAPTIRSLPSLVDLRITRNELGEQGVSMLVTGWTAPNQLTHLVIWLNELNERARWTVPAAWNDRVKVEWTQGLARSR